MTGRAVMDSPLVSPLRLRLPLRLLGRVKPVRRVEAPTDVGAKQAAVVHVSITQDGPGERVRSGRPDPREVEHLAFVLLYLMYERLALLRIELSNGFAREVSEG